MPISGGSRRAVMAGLALLCAGMFPPPTVSGAEDPPESIAQAPYADAYVIGVEDLLEISVWKNQDLTKTVPVRPDGKISLPLIDEVQAAGLTPMQLKEQLQEKWSAFLSAPEVSVIVKEINSFKVFLVGQVVRPGELRLRDTTRLLQAISLAGGFTTFANTDEIVVLRGAGPHKERFEINIKKVVSGSRPDDDLVLIPGDTIYVP